MRPPGHYRKGIQFAFPALSLLDSTAVRRCVTHSCERSVFHNRKRSRESGLRAGSRCIRHLRLGVGSWPLGELLLGFQWRER
jgi:hypothetical protein